MAERFEDVLTLAVDDLVANGFDTAQRVEGWLARLRRAAEESLQPPAFVEEQIRNALDGAYRRQVEQGMVLIDNPGASRFTVEKVRPELRSELDRRILASADLIRRNRTEAIEKTLRRFSGWSTSIPAGGSNVTDKRQTKKDIKKSLGQLPFEQRRVLIDQGHKLVSAVNEIVATGGGAIAAMWHSRYRQAGYNYREDHKERDGEVYLIRDSWAHERGLVKPGEAGYYDKITKPGEEVFCRCSAAYLYNLRDLPADMLTAKGRAQLKAVRIEADSTTASA